MFQLEYAHKYSSGVSVGIPPFTGFAFERFILFLFLLLIFIFIWFCNGIVTESLSLEGGLEEPEEFFCVLASDSFDLASASHPSIDI